MSENTELPKNWIKCELGEVVEIHDNERKPINNSERNSRIENKALNELFPYYGATGQVGWIDDFLSNEESVLVGEDAAPFLDPIKNKAYLVKGKFWVNNHAHILRGLQGYVSNKFILHQMNYVDYQEHVSGSTRLKLTKTALTKMPFTLCPFNEQNRITDKIDELFSELDAGVKELEAAQIKLKHYRQSLLKSAVEGALTQKWRDDNKDKIEETGKELLNRILIERKQRWEQNKLEEFKEKGKKPPKNWQDKYPEPVQPDTTDLPELPESWVWASVDQLVYESSYGTSVKCAYETGNTPVLRIPNVINKKVSISDLKETVDLFDIGLNKQLLSGDILIVRTNGSLSLMGQTALVRDIEDGFYFASYLLRLRTPMDTILPEWMDLYFGSKNARAWIENQASSSAGQNNISLSKFSNLHVPLPPLEEQVQLISMLANEFDSIDRQNEATDLGLKQSEAQRKNILKSAFSGQLVPQDPDDEPASVLLEKIKQERVAIAKISKPRKQSKPRKRVELMNTLLEVLTAENDWIDAQNAFQKCGIVDGTSTDRIEEIYTELRKLEKTGRIKIQRQGDFDQLKLTTQDIKED
ncbi:restriction endonuclease subunit S [Pseudoalteromonas rubra]|uniref:Restriction endonuclease subunit S n=1 Tax=Pseudoalteromonas rubra TaxID=43658 RepID=A0A4Q7E5V7_9GAMM|nr:restriction endonuclease subunit S [Pseudoalteromonas rubra]RZM77495.1 restriction endonuclease subunit S [Pseudoalteromonas rubra]